MTSQEKTGRKARQLHQYFHCFGLKSKRFREVSHPNVTAGTHIDWQAQAHRVFLRSLLASHS